MIDTTHIGRLRRGHWDGDKAATREILDDLHEHYHQMIALLLILWTTEHPAVTQIREVHRTILEAIEENGQFK